MPKLNLTNSKKGSKPLAIACKFLPNIKKHVNAKMPRSPKSNRRIYPAFTKNLAEFDGNFKSGLAQICRRSDRFFVSFALNFTPKSGKAKFIRTFLIGA